jgi:hypothetical protein
MFDEESSSIVSRYREWQRASRSVETVRSKLLPFLTAQPPQSLASVAAQLGLGTAELYTNHREIAHAISARHAAYVKECRAKRIEALKGEVHRIMIELESHGVYPSLKQIWSLLTAPFIRDPAVVCRVRREIRQELDVSTKPSEQVRDS